mmetsp:Transcript_347/g.596  ORF Transcript_347/g.596 Transcript_347/m.596 type:complete len:454 (-) Transcript_347:13-1374(-)
MDSDEPSKVRVKLVSILPEYNVPSDDIAVPSSIRRPGLSKVVNYLLGNADDSGSDSDSNDDDNDDDGNNNKSSLVEFDFLVDNKFLRQSVEGYLRSNNISSEDVLRIDFLPKAKKPEEDKNENEALPDWVSSLSYSNISSTVASGCYDGTIRIYDPVNMSTLTALPCHSSSIRCVASSGSSPLLASGGHDQQLLVHSYSANQKSPSLSTTLSLQGMTNSVESIAFADDSSLLAAGDFSGMLCIYDVNAETSDQTSETTTSSKKRKTDKKNSSVSTKDLSPLHSNKLHVSAVSGIVFSADSKTLYSSSYDFSVRATDIATQNPLLTLNGNKVATCLAKPTASSKEVLATGHADSRIKLWDMRVGVDAAAATYNSTLRPSHKGYISGLAFDPTDSFKLSSSSYDGLVKTWDIRCELPMHTIKAHNKDDGKALAVCYGENSIFSAGTDGNVKKWAI